MALYDLLEHLPQVVVALNDYVGPHEALLGATFTSKLQACLNSTAQYKAMVEATMDFNALAANKYLVKADFDEQLADLRQTMDGIAADVHAHYRDIMDRLRMTDKSLHLEVPMHILAQCHDLFVTCMAMGFAPGRTNTIWPRIRIASV
eukprot:SAG31_NODE_430_length_15792_cov_15.908558_5_plen_148_part_00